MLQVDCERFYVRSGPPELTIAIFVSGIISRQSTSPVGGDVIVKVDFRFGMVNMALGGWSKCTKRPSRSPYLRDLGLSFQKNQKVWKKSI